MKRRRTTAVTSRLSPTRHRYADRRPLDANKTCSSSSSQTEPCGRGPQRPATAMPPDADDDDVGRTDGDDRVAAAGSE